MAEPQGQNEITFFAETNFRGTRKRFGIKRADRRKHVYIIGKTGMGKSTLLENMTIQDIQAGRGVAVVDPHGEYAERILRFVPEQRINDVVYFSPSDIEYPIAFNVMEQVAEDQRHLVSSALLGVFKKIFGVEVFSARMEYLLSNAILALLETPGSTLLGINRIFGEKEFRKRVVTRLHDPVVRGFWENEFAKYPEQYMREAVGAIQNKVGQFSSNPLIRNIIGQVESSVDMRKIMDEEKIFIINLSKGKVGEENSRLLGAMLVTKLYLAAMSRVDIPESERKDFYLYVDEFQNFPTESFANILSEARKYRLDLTIAHQYIAQMEEEVQHAIFGNVGTMICFRVGAEDAELLEKEFMPEIVIQDLVNLGFKNIYLKLMIDGLTSRPFSAETLAPQPEPAASYAEAIIKASRERYGAPRALVEDKIRQFTLGSDAVTMVSPGLGMGASDGATVPAAAAPGMVLPAPPKPDRPMYEARCAVDGKVIMVPFQPDGKRPVFCEEHMGMIQFRSKMAAGGEFAAPPATRGKEGAGGSGQASRPIPRVQRPEPLPLARLRPDSGAPRPRTEGQRNASAGERTGAKKDDHLEGLRQALADAVRKQQGAKAPESKPESAPAAPTPHPVVPESKATVLQPGETIRFE